jgi:hypothetical protein
VWCTQVLEHVPDPLRAARELSRVARRGFIELPSRTGEMMNGNPTHRWVVDREGDTLVFHPRTFVEHPFDNLLYAHLFRDAAFRDRCDREFRNVLNHQLLSKAFFAFASKHPRQLRSTTKIPSRPLAPTIRSRDTVSRRVRK